ncbi:hypothetical protein G5V59_18375 [Nocardioides sp. W3-2-3]|nr:hypothetical protein [Nocardioides convexus]
MRRHLPRLVITPAALATAAVVGLGPSAHAADPATCGQPAVPAVYVAVEHPAVVTTVPAVTHQEWAWQRTVATSEAEHSRVVTPATGYWTWSRSVEVMEREFARTVVDRAAVPAVVETMWQYVQQQTGNLRWERAGWNAGDNGKGWSPTGLTRDDVVTPAVTGSRTWSGPGCRTATTRPRARPRPATAGSPGASWRTSTCPRARRPRVPAGRAAPSPRPPPRSPTRSGSRWTRPPRRGTSRPAPPAPAHPPSSSPPAPRPPRRPARAGRPFPAPR